MKKLSLVAMIAVCAPLVIACSNQGTTNENEVSEKAELVASSTSAIETNLTNDMNKEQSDEKKTEGDGHIVVMETSMGNIEIELDPSAAPISSKNFLSYVDEGFYDGLIFHRVINNFMIQGGGFDKDMNQKKTKEAIANEAGNGLKNDLYTLAMARTNVINSATSQFFINVKSNDFLNHRDETPQGFGYAVFGKVSAGMDVVDKIKAVQTGVVNGMRDVPSDPVVIIKAYRK